MQQVPWEVVIRAAVKASCCARVLAMATFYAPASENEAPAAGAYSVLEAADGREGVRRYREHRPALVLVDIVMPEKDGIETGREILAIDAAAVIFTMTGEAGARGDERRDARHPSGADQEVFHLIRLPSHT